MPGVSFNLLFFKRFCKILGIIFPRFLGANTLLFASLLCLVLLQQVVIYQVGMLPSQFYLVLGERDLNGFQNTIGYALLLIISIAFLLATDKYVCGVFYITSRDLITRHLHQGYFKGIKFYYLNVLSNSIDNPDQRITQDVDKTCKQFSSIIAQLLISPFTIAYYMYKTWMVTGYLGPICVVAFFIVSTVINKFLMSPVAELVYKQEKLEGDFRFKHMSIRSNAEPAALYRSGKIEQEKTNKKLSTLVATQQKLVVREYGLNFSVQLASYVGSILSYLIVAIPIFGGKYDDLTPTQLSAVISQTAFITIYLISCFTKLIDMSLTTADMIGTTHRVCQLIESLEQEEEGGGDFGEGAGLGGGDFGEGAGLGGGDFGEGAGFASPVYVDSADPVSPLHLGSSGDRGAPGAGGDEGPAFVLDKVTYSPPNAAQTPLVRDLSLEVIRGRNLLITGDSGCGKSSLVRILGKLWTHTSGQVRRRVGIGHHGVMYLPQKPMLTDGTLREQIIYPFRENGHRGLDDHEILATLEGAGLGGLVARTGGLDSPVDWNWYDSLSPGEMQRLSFVRLFYHRPPYAVLDEATSQVGADMEGLMYGRCEELGITVISVGHRVSLRKYHHQELRIKGKGDWALEQIINV